MIVPAWLFTMALWLAPFVVGGAALFLLIVLVKEWRDGQLW